MDGSIWMLGTLFYCFKICEGSNVKIKPTAAGVVLKAWCSWLWMCASRAARHTNIIQVFFLMVWLCVVSVHTHLRLDFDRFMCVFTLSIAVGSDKSKIWIAASIDQFFETPRSSSFIHDRIVHFFKLLIILTSELRFYFFFPQIAKANVISMLSSYTIDSFWMDALAKFDLKIWCLFT